MQEHDINYVVFESEQLYNLFNNIMIINIINQIKCVHTTK